MMMFDDDDRNEIYIYFFFREQHSRSDDTEQYCFVDASFVAPFPSTRRAITNMCMCILYTTVLIYVRVCYTEP